MVEPSFVPPERSPKENGHKYADAENDDKEEEEEEVEKTRQSNDMQW